MLCPLAIAILLIPTPPIDDPCATLTPTGEFNFWRCTVNNEELNQEYSFVAEPDQQPDSSSNRMIGQIADDSEVLKDFQNRSGDGRSETVCGCSGSCNCAPCNCLTDRAVAGVEEAQIRNGQFKTDGDILNENIQFAVEDLLLQQTEGEFDLEGLRGQLSERVGEIVDNFVERLQQTRNQAEDSFDLNALGFPFDSET
jgi:hypothetical protein